MMSNNRSMDLGPSLQPPELYNDPGFDVNASSTRPDYSDYSVLGDHAMARWLIQRIMLPAICSVGISGILLTSIVLSQKTMCTSTNCYLMAMSTADLFFLLLLSSILIDERFTPFSAPYYHFVIYVTHTAIFMQMCQLASVWLTVMLAVERFIAICKPFLASTVCTVFRARMMIVLIFALAFLCRLPNFWENKIVTVHDTLTNTSLTYMEATELSLDEHYTTWYPWIIEGVLTSILPFLLLLFLNARLIWEVRKSSEYLKRHQLLWYSDSNLILIREEQQITFMLISIIIVFFLCQAPYVIYTALVSINRFVAHSRHIMLFRDVTVLMLSLKSAVNFVLYCWFSEKFLTTLRGLAGRCSMFRRQPSSRRESHFSRQSTTTSTRDTYI